MASATVALSCSETYSVFIMPPAVSSSNSSSSRTSVFGRESISSRISSEVSSSSSESTSAASSGRHFLDDVGGLFRLQRFQDAGLHLGIDFGERFGGDFAVDGFEDGLAFGGAEFLDDVGQVGGVHLLQLVVRDVEAQPPQGVGLHHVAELPADGVGRDGPLQAADPAGRQHALQQPAEDAADADIHFEHREGVAHAVVAGSPW